ncbi:MAG: hypothetical protein WBP13_06895 [Methylophilaceae bacterium]
MKYYILDKISQTMGSWEGIFRYGFAPYDDFNNEHSIYIERITLYARRAHSLAVRCLVAYLPIEHN